MSKIIVEYKNLGKSYKTRKGKEIQQALDGIDFAVQENEFATLVGPSGCGKTTLLKITCGLLPYDRGEVIVDGARVEKPIKNVGMVFQTPILLQWRTTIQNVMLPVEILGLEEKKYHNIARDLIKMVGLEGYENRFPYELSGGMQQRVSMCRALIHDPTLLLMDEPFGALDAISRDKMDVELMRIWQERKKTVIFVTHSVPEAVFLADKVVVMTCGPGKVAGVIKIDLSRPRSIETQYTKEFRDYCRDILVMIGGR